MGGLDLSRNELNPPIEASPLHPSSIRFLFEHLPYLQNAQLVLTQINHSLLSDDNPTLILLDLLL